MSVEEWGNADAMNRLMAVLVNWLEEHDDKEVSRIGSLQRAVFTSESQRDLEVALAGLVSWAQEHGYIKNAQRFVVEPWETAEEALERHNVSEKAVVINLPDASDKIQ